MIRDLQYPEDARNVIDSLLAGLKYDAAIAIMGRACSRSQIEGSLPDFSTGIRCGGREQDEAVRRDAPGLLSRFSIISMVSRFEVHTNLLLLERRVIEELGSSGRKMSPDKLWAILRRVHEEYRQGPVRVCSALLVQKPSAQLASRMTWLDGIYRVRNCLAHRLGKVQMIDVKKPGTSLSDVRDTDTLKVVWLRAKATLNGKEIKEFPHQAVSGGEMTVNFEEYEREWKVGDQIEVTPDDCQGIAISLSLLASQILRDFESEMNALLA